MGKLFMHLYHAYYNANIASFKNNWLINPSVFGIAYCKYDVN